MTKTIPNYLRVHRGPRPSDDVSASENVESDASFWNAYTEVTGWRVDQEPSRLDAKPNLLPADNAIEEKGASSDQSAPDVPPPPTVPQSSAQRLADAAARLSRQLNQTRTALRRQEAELAARAAVVVGMEDQGSLADRIESTLSMAAAACGCDSAAMYMLDDETQFLKTRAVHGLPLDRLEQPARALKGSRGDLEALVRGVITIDDVGAGPIDTWCSPETCASAICASINNASVPIGTLWLYSKTPKEFTAAHSTAAKMAAAQLVTELAAAAVDRKPMMRRKADEAIRDIANWQYETLPTGTALAEGWLVDGMIESAQPWATGWHHWDVLPDGSLVLAIAEAQDESMAGALTATIARAAMVAHIGYRHTPAQIMQRVNDTLWHTSTGDQLTSLSYVRVDPESGEGEIVSAGSISAMVVNRYGFRPLMDGRSDPLASHIDAAYRSTTFRMMTGETLFAHGPGLGASGTSQSALGDQLRGSMERNEKSPLASVRRSLANHPLDQERGAVTLLRQ